MPRSLKKIAFLLEDFSLPSPAQQLLDRFLMGYPREGEFRQPLGWQVCCYLEGWTSELERRIEDFGLARAETWASAVEGADAIIIVGGGSQACASESRLLSIFDRITNGCPCFLYGLPAETLSSAKRLAVAAAARQIPWLAGTALPWAWRLPPIELELNARLKEALIVVPGVSPTAEIEGLEGILPIVERRWGGESGIRKATFLQYDAVWRAGVKGIWSWRLLGSALSRSDSPQGDPVKDGRTQDLVGLGLVPKLARFPRGWIFEHRDGLRTTILVFDGVVADYNFAVRKCDGEVISAQLYRPPSPAQNEFDWLAAALEDFFTTGKPIWPARRGLLEAGLWEIIQDPAYRTGCSVPTPELRQEYLR